MATAHVPAALGMEQATKQTLLEKDHLRPPPNHPERHLSTIKIFLTSASSLHSSTAAEKEDNGDEVAPVDG